jgi:hypothetical protein
LLRDLGCDLGRDAPCSAVGDVAVDVDGAEVTSRGDIVRPDLEVDPGRLQHATADIELKRIETEKRRVTGPGANGDAMTGGQRLTDRPFPRETVEMRRRRHVQFSTPARTGQPAKPVEHAEHNTGFRGDGETADEIEVHKQMLTLRRLAVSRGCSWSRTVSGVEQRVDAGQRLSGKHGDEGRAAGRDVADEVAHAGAMDRRGRLATADDGRGVERGEDASEVERAVRESLLLKHSHRAVPDGGT